jgi:hypothetical protein
VIFSKIAIPVIQGDNLPEEDCTDLQEHDCKSSSGPKAKYKFSRKLLDKF